MQPNSNMTITDFKINPTSQQISEIYINGEKLETGSEPTLQNKSATITSMEQFDTFATGRYVKTLEPSEGYDGLSKATVQISALLFAADNMKMVTLKSGSMTVQALIQNTDATSIQGYINTFGGTLYINSSSTLTKTEYTVTTDACGHKIVTINNVSYTQIKLGWE